MAESRNAAHIGGVDTEEGFVEYEVPWVDIGRLKALDGSVIVVSTEGLDPHQGLFMVADRNAAYVDTAIRWLAIITCFAAGICLCKAARRGKIPAEKP